MSEKLMVIRLAILTVLTVVFTIRGAFDLVLWITNVHPDTRQFFGPAMQVNLMPMVPVVAPFACRSAMAVANIIVGKRDR